MSHFLWLQTTIASFSLIKFYLFFAKSAHIYGKLIRAACLSYAIVRNLSIALFHSPSDV
ncbi:MAG: hypothetical protein HC895_25465 [Leptolyngbyaceae cyanobacterium SM1_3_5]|nr:hypothetical protein [Leptolyngbyaceae cyanobacterium SM1_3_5]